MTDIRIIATQFESKILPKEQWTHSAHIAVAFVQLDKHKNFKSLYPLMTKPLLYRLAILQLTAYRTFLSKNTTFQLVLKITTIQATTKH